MVPAGETACGHTGYLLARRDRLYLITIPGTQLSLELPRLELRLAEAGGPPPLGGSRMCGSQRTYGTVARALIAILLGRFRACLETGKNGPRSCLSQTGP
jgi:hypothetical protein